MTREAPFFLGGRVRRNRCLGRMVRFLRTAFSCVHHPKIDGYHGCLFVSFCLKNTAGISAYGRKKLNLRATTKLNPRKGLTRVPVIRLTFLGVISKFLRNTVERAGERPCGIPKTFVFTVKGKI
jgi:hypothetical protein